MNLAIANAARRRRAAGASGDPDAIAAAAAGGRSSSRSSCSISAGLTDKTHRRPRARRPPVLPDRRRQDRGLSRARRLRHRPSAAVVPAACWAPASRVIMRYTLRLLTLDQLSRAAGVVCALELMRTDPAFADDERPPTARRLADRDRALGRLATPRPTSSAARGNTGDHTAVTRRAPLPNGRAATRRRRSRPARGAARRSRRTVFDCVPNEQRAAEPDHHLRQPGLRLHPRSAAADADRRRGDLSPAAGVPDRHGRQVRGPALGRRGGRVLRPCRPYDEDGFYGAAEPRGGRPLVQRPRRSIRPT